MDLLCHDVVILREPLILATRCSFWGLLWEAGFGEHDGVYPHVGIGGDNAKGRVILGIDGNSQMQS
jgi:hypothetical protein